MHLLIRFTLLVVEYNGSPLVSLAVYPNANADVRKIEGFNRLFGFKTATPCKTSQSSSRDSYPRFDTTLMLRYIIHRKSKIFSLLLIC